MECEGVYQRPRAASNGGGVRGPCRDSPIGSVCSDLSGKMRPLLSVYLRGVYVVGITKKGRPSRQDPPDQLGLYRLTSKSTGEIKYIGETSDLERRKGEQFRSDKPVSPETHHFEWQVADRRGTSRTRREHERRKIDQHNPSMNKKRGGGGKYAKHSRSKDT